MPVRKGRRGRRVVDEERVVLILLILVVSNLDGVEEVSHVEFTE